MVSCTRGSGQTDNIRGLTLKISAHAPRCRFVCKTGLQDWFTNEPIHRGACAYASATRGVSGCDGGKMVPRTSPPIIAPPGVTARAAMRAGLKSCKLGGPLSGFVDRDCVVAGKIGVSAKIGAAPPEVSLLNTV